MDLQHLPFFQRFSTALREALIEAGEVESFARGETVFSSGDNHTDFFLLLKGRLQIYKVSKGGQKRILRTVMPGDTFALVSLFDEQPMFITAEVMGDEAQVFVVHREAFMELMDRSPELAHFVIDGLVRRIRRYGDAVANMTVYYVDQRFISLLLSLADQQKSDDVVLPDSVSALARQLGTAREVLSREISKLVKKGWIEKKGQQICILKRKMLEDRLQEG